MTAAIQLTFDDGPDPVWTPRVLDALARRGLPATFFVIAPLAAAHPALIRRQRAEGHRVELHCHDHVRHTDLDPDTGREDARRGLALLDGLGVAPGRWRTPWGVTAPWTADVAREYGLELCGWDVDTHDWRGDSAEQMLATPGLDDGGIVLLHDGLGPGARRDGCAETVRFVEAVAA